MDLVNLSVGNAALVAVGGYLVVFVGIVLLMIFITILGKILNRKKAEKKAGAVVTAITAEPAAEKAKAPGSCGELKLYDTDPRDAALIMAIVADKLGKPLNELRFISIREVKDHEI